MFGFAKTGREKDEATKNEKSMTMIKERIETEKKQKKEEKLDGVSHKNQTKQQ